MRSGAPAPGEPDHLRDAYRQVPPDLTVVIPTFNERDNIEPLLQRLAATLAGVRWEAIFVDDNSPDGTGEVLRSIGARDGRVRCIRRFGRRGLSGASIEGMLAAQAPLVAVMDADLQHDDKLLPAMLEATGAGADLVVASRYVEGGDAAGLSGTRSALSQTATLMAKTIFHVSSSDPMSGFFMVRRAVVESVAPKLSNQGFKILFDILSAGGPDLKIVELPYTFGARHSGESKLDNRVMVDFLGLLLAKASGGLLTIQFVSFAAVGTVGLAAHLIALRLGLLAGASFAMAQTLATVLAMTLNFLLNNALTYRDQRLRGWPMLSGLGKFYAICGLGAAANIGLANWAFWETSRWWLAGIAGAAIGAVWNYAMSKALVWRGAA